MKKKSISAALALCLLCCSAFSMTAFAAENQTSATTSVLYTVQGGYTVNIPASVNLNSDEMIQITADELTIPSGKDLVVRLSDDCLDDESRFVLTSSGGSSVSFNLLVSHLESDADQDGNFAGSSFVFKSQNGKGTEVARFSSLSIERYEQFIPSRWGRLCFLATSAAKVSGEYSGQLNFIIGLEEHVNY